MYPSVRPARRPITVRPDARADRDGRLHRRGGIRRAHRGPAAAPGRRAAFPKEFIETAWCSMAHFPPGLLTRYGRLFREPFGRVHWAGTETATTSHGAIDGAVRSGERAAAEILARD